MTNQRIVILGAAGRDFHNFNVVYRDDPAVTVVAFTATQIPGIAGRRYPPSLAGPRYPGGIPIVDESTLEALCRSEGVTHVVFAYSDVSHAHVMRVASRALAAGPDFVLLGPERTMLRARAPVVAVSAVRTGCGKSPIARWLGRRLRDRGRRVVVLRHPMPYADLGRQRSQRFETPADLDAAGCTLEEREEYEPHLAAGNVVFAGVDYAEIAVRAAAEADLLVWDGGNNDFPFLRPDLHIVVADALRPDDARGYHPGEAVLRTADVVVVNKVDVATREQVERAVEVVRVAGFVAAHAAGAIVVDPRSAATPAIREVFTRYPHIGPVLPAIGYSAAQIDALRATVDAVDAEVVIAATPVDLARLMVIGKRVVRARYEFAEADEPGLGDLVDGWLAGRSPRAA